MNTAPLCAFEHFLHEGSNGVLSTGQKFAILEEKIVISTVLRQFRIETVDKLEDINLMNEIILRPEAGVRVKLYPRHQD